MAETVVHTGGSMGQRGNRGGSRRPWRGRSAQDRSFHTREKPTHFLSVPLDYLQGFTSQITAFTDALQGVSPPITGLDPSIIISPRRLHLTLGVMSLVPEDKKIQHNGGSSQERGTDRALPRKSINDALALLNSLKLDIESTLQGQPLQLCLSEFNVMRCSPNGEADVMYIGPAASGIKIDGHARSVSILETVNRKFIEEGFITETRPLKLHCTIINTTYRKPAAKNGGRRVPFSMTQIEASIAQNPDTTGTLLSSENILAIRELNICKMGSYDELGRYIKIGGIEW